MSIFLIGLMGSGKTTVGNELAQALNSPFIDTDAEIATTENASIANIFELHGEQYFRQLETKWLQNYQAIKLEIIATGGGMPCFENNIALLLAKGFVVFLNPPVDVLVKRLSRTSQKAIRPLLQNKTEPALTSFLTNLLQTRFAYYSRAHYTVSSDQVSISTIINAYKSYAEK